MSTLVLVTYATRYCSTREVAEVIASALRESGLAVDIQPGKRHTRLDSNPSMGKQSDHEALACIDFHFENS
jgi:menaquinone-dependent protoporphyrinogen IX oxidase